MIGPGDMFAGRHTDTYTETNEHILTQIDVLVTMFCSLTGNGVKI